VVGELGQYESQQRWTDTAYIPWTNFYTGQTIYIPVQGQQWIENYVSVSLRIIDVETGKVIFSGAGQFTRGLTDPPQMLAELITGEILSDWLNPPGRLGIYIGEPMDYMMQVINKKEIAIGKVMVGSPASLAGIKAGDRILKWNGVGVFDLLANWELQRAMYGYPGQKVELEILRGDKVLKFTVTRVSKYSLKEWMLIQ
jgi:membrane-associated protease RseP (regulator of RpoE activity)